MGTTGRIISPMTEATVADDPGTGETRGVQRSIIRGSGLTASERRLAALADRAFLRLWSYPNTFNDRTMSAAGGGQEFADLLAVFDRHVVLFSDKEVAWQSDRPLSLAWSRWHRRAVEDSVGQLVGAERWLRQHFDRIYTDKACTQPLPIALPVADTRVVHLVAVAGGANAACRRHLGHPRGTMMIQHGLRRAGRSETGGPALEPFTFGDVNPGGTFVHVFDEYGLGHVMTELDTVADLTEYLAARARFLRSGRPVFAAGEEDLLAAYMMNGFIDGRPGFVPVKRRKKARRAGIMIPEGEHETYVGSDLHAQMSVLKDRSRLWDATIEMVSEAVLTGSSVAILDQPPSVELSERALRIMAGEKRLDRVKLAHSMREAVVESVRGSHSRFVRRLLMGRRPPARETGYLFLVLPFSTAAGSYEDYREYRARMLETYCLAFLREQPRLLSVVGLALDVRVGPSGVTTHSEDVIAMDAPDWTPELSAYLVQNAETFGLRDPSELRAVGREWRVRNPFRANKIRWA